MSPVPYEAPEAAAPAPAPRRPTAALRVDADAPEVCALLRGLRGRRCFVVACSGGPDSQALLHWSAAVAPSLGLTHLGAVGIDHGLRPGAQAELALVRASCAALGLPFVERTLAPLPPGNLMQAARLARRRALGRAARAAGADAVLLGHTADDQAETVLQHLARGAGLAGAAGMPAASGRNVRFVRPWLGVERAQVLAYLRQHGIAWANDPSNVDLRRSRAVLRHEVLPALARPYAAAVRHLAAFAAGAAADEALLRRLAARALRRCQTPSGALALGPLLRLPPAVRARALRRWLGALGANPDRRALARLFAELASGPPGRPLAEGALPGVTLVRTLAGQVPGGEVLRATRAGELRARRRGPGPTDRAPAIDQAAVAGSGPAAVRLLPGREVRWGPWALAVERLSGAQLAAYRAAPARPATSVAFAIDSPHAEIWLRSWRKGDRLRPFGLGGSTTVSALFINAKVARAMRPSWPVATLDGELAWVVGLRRGRQYPLHPKATVAWALHARWCAPAAEAGGEVARTACGGGA